MQLGPATFRGNYYQYSMVTGPRRVYLFVLARNVTEFKQNYDDDVLATLKEQGFTKFYNKPTRNRPTRGMIAYTYRQCTLYVYALLECLHIRIDRFTC